MGEDEWVLHNKILILPLGRLEVQVFYRTNVWNGLDLACGIYIFHEFLLTGNRLPFPHRDNFGGGRNRVLSPKAMEMPINQSQNNRWVKNKEKCR